MVLRGVLVVDEHFLIVYIRSSRCEYHLLLAILLTWQLLLTLSLNNIFLADIWAGKLIVFFACLVCCLLQHFRNILLAGGDAFGHLSNLLGTVLIKMGIKISKSVVHIRLSRVLYHKLACVARETGGDLVVLAMLLAS